MKEEKKSRIEILCFYNIDENLQKILYLPNFTIMPLKCTMNNVLKASRIYCNIHYSGGTGT